MARTYTGPRRAEQLARKRQVLKANRTFGQGKRRTSVQLRVIKAQAAMMAAATEEV